MDLNGFWHLFVHVFGSRMLPGIQGLACTMSGNISWTSMIESYYISSIITKCITLLNIESEAKSRKHLSLSISIYNFRWSNFSMISVPCDNTHWAPHCFHCWVLCDWVSLAFGETPDLLAQRSWALIPALALNRKLGKLWKHEKHQTTVCIVYEV